MTDSYPNWFNKNKFKNFLAIIDSNKFNYKHKISEFKYFEIKDSVNNIKNNRISEIFPKKGLNALSELKNAEIIKYKKRTPGQKELLNSFNDFSDTILADKTLKSENQEHNNLMSSKDENENVNENENENDKALMSSNDENEKQNKLLNNDNNANVKNKKSSTNTKKDENKNMLLEYMGGVHDKLFKKYSNSKILTVL